MNVSDCLSISNHLPPRTEVVDPVIHWHHPSNRPLLDDHAH